MLSTKKEKKVDCFIIEYHAYEKYTLCNALEKSWIAILKLGDSQEKLWIVMQDTL